MGNLKENVQPNAIQRLLIYLTEYFLITVFVCVLPTVSQTWTVFLLQQEEVTFSIAKCRSQALECNRQRTLTGHLPHLVPEQEVSQQPADATHQMCKMSLRLRPSSGSVLSAGLMAHTPANPHANSEEAREPDLVSQTQTIMEHEGRAIRIWCFLSCINYTAKWEVDSLWGTDNISIIRAENKIQDVTNTK